MYQDYRKKERTEYVDVAKAFPKLLMFELIDVPSEYNSHMVRIYEKLHLDQNIDPTIIYAQLDGKYVDAKGNECKGDQLKKRKGEPFNEIHEVITGMHVFEGSMCDPVLKKFFKKYRNNVASKYKGMQYSIEVQKGE